MADHQEIRDQGGVTLFYTPDRFPAISLPRPEPTNATCDQSEARSGARSAAGRVLKHEHVMSAEAVPGDRYILATGPDGAARLALLDQVSGPDATRIMTAIGIPRGGRVADIGCGTGNTARWFANMVGPEGQVAAVDVSDDQLALAQSTAEADGLGDIEFMRASAYDTGLPRDHFDVVHCRFLL